MSIIDANTLLNCSQNITNLLRGFHAWNFEGSEVKGIKLLVIIKCNIIYFYLNEKRHYLLIKLFFFFVNDNKDVATKKDSNKSSPAKNDSNKDPGVKKGDNKDFAVTEEYNARKKLKDFPLG